ncbi:hypothetical protein [Mycolicibacterium fortuitum]|uniref:hypothetical protein n=1 Tax=Mycolicibacterium fortuitum TaxID=1766 RepID=UPI00096E30A9|nr:hypothetical protein [Mycolicibacterium fortuitum]OMC07279.1 hypothetical protein A5734_03555 [Mycolicibacterium fortuitum]
MTTVEKPDHDESDVEEVAATDSTKEEAADGPTDSKLRRQLSISVRSLLTGVVVVAAAIGVAALGWLYVDARHELAAQERRSQDYARAENVALDYAVDAAQINSQDLNPWKAKLVAGTGPELSAKLTKAGQEMEQILVPLQWNSTATPLAARVRTETAGVYTVDCFVSVQTKTVQGPEPLQSTATYSVTIDSNHDWQITDVGGIGSVVGPK